MGWGGVRVDVNEELKFCENSKKKLGGGRGGWRGGVWGGWVGGSGWIRTKNLSFGENSQKKIGGGGVRSGGQVGGGGVGLVGGQGGCERNVWGRG